MNEREIIRKCILDILGLFSRPKAGIHILNGHLIHRTLPRIDIFVSLLEQLQHYVRFIKIEEAVDLIANRTQVNEPLVAFTFDDGFEECSTMIAPALEQFGTNGLFFINPNFVDGDEEYIRNFTENIVLTPGKQPMRWNDIINLQKAGHIIGAHTMDHFMINDENCAELEYQIVHCKRVIEEKLHTSCDHFAFPFGRIEHANQQSIDMATKHFKYVFSQSDYKNYFSFDGKVINRRHFEPNWPVSHVKYFINCQKKY